MAVDIDTLTIEIESSSEQAVSNLNALDEALKRVRHTISQGGWNNPLKNMGSGSGGTRAESRVASRSNGLRDLGRKIKLKIDASDADKATRKVSALSKTLSALKRIAFYRAIRTAIKELASAIQEGAERAYFYSKQFGDSTRYISEALDSISSKSFKMGNQMGAAWATLLATLEPVITKIINLIQRAVEVITQFFALLGGKTTYLKAKDYAKSYADAAQKGADATEEWKNQLMGFDEINRLEDTKDKDRGGGGGLNDYGNMFEEAPIDAFDGIKNTINDFFKNLDPRIKIEWDTGLAELWAALQDAWRKIKELFKTITLDFVIVLNSGRAAETLKHIFDILKGLVDLAGILADRLRQAWEKNDIGRKILENIWDIFNEILGTISKLIQLTVEWAKNLNFTPLLESIEKYTGAFLNYIKEVDKRILWLYENVILPMAKWIIEVAIPAVLNLKAAWLNLNAAIMEKCYPVWEWFWREILIPFGKWVGEVLIKWINDLTKTFESLTKKIKESDSLSDFLMKLDGKEAILIGLAAGFEAVAVALSLWKGIDTVVKGVTSALKLLTSPAGIAILAIAGVVAGLITLYQRSEKAREKIDALIEKIKEFDIKQFRMDIHDILFKWDNLNAEDVVKKLIGTFSTFIGAGLGFTLGGVPGAVIGTLTGIAISAIISTATFDNDKELSGEEVKTLLKPALAGLLGAAIGLGVAGVPGAMFGFTIGVVADFLIKNLDFVSLEDVARKIKTKLILLKADIKFELNKIWQTIGDDLKDPTFWTNIFDKLMENIGKAFGTIANSLLETGKNIVQKIIDGMKQFLFGNTEGSGLMLAGEGSGLRNIGKAIIDGLTGGIEEKINKIADWIDKHVKEPFIRGFKSTFGIHSPSEEMKPLGADILEGIKQGIIDAIVGIGEWIKEKIFKPIVDGIKSVFGITDDDATSMNDIGKSIIEGVKKGIDTVIKEIGDWVKSHISDPIINGIKSVFGISESSDAEELKPIGQSIISGIKTGIDTIISTIGTWIDTNIFKPIRDGIKAAFGITGDDSTNMHVFGENILTGIKNGILNAIRAIGTWIESNIWEPFRTGLRNILGPDQANIRLFAFGANVITGIKNGIVNGLTGIGDWVYTTIWSPLCSGMNQIIDQINEWWKGITSFFSDAQRSVAQAQGSITHQAQNGHTFGGSGGSFAQGGFVNSGELFLAREAGPELVGSIGSRTAVANNDQILEGIADAVYDAFMEAFSQTGGSGGNSSQPVNIYLDGQVIARSTTRYQHQYARMTG